MDAARKAVIFTAGNEEYGVDVHDVISIEKYENVTPIPQLPVYMKGMAKVRGDLLPVLDLEQALYGRALDYVSTAKMIVLETHGFVFGLLVKEAKEITEIPAELLKQAGLIAYKKTSFFSSIANLEGRLITMISPERLIESLTGIKEIKEYMKKAEEELAQV